MLAISPADGGGYLLLFTGKISVYCFLLILRGAEISVAMRIKSPALLMQPLNKTEVWKNQPKTLPACLEFAAFLYYA